MLVQINLWLPDLQSSLFMYILLLWHEAIYAPFPWAHSIWKIYCNMCLWKGDGTEKTADLFGDFQCKLWRYYFWSSVTVISCYTHIILLNKVRLRSSRRQSSVLLNNTAALLKTQDLAKFGSDSTLRPQQSFPVTSAHLWLLSDYHRMNLVCKNYCPKSSHYWGLCLSLHIQFLNCFVKFVNGFRHD